MKVTKALFIGVLALGFIGGAMAVPPGMTVEFAGGPMGKVTFDGKIHADKGLACDSCHTKIFQMKKGTAKITMDSINKGENCGVCHNGTTAFKASDPQNCARCHKK